MMMSLENMLIDAKGLRDNFINQLDKAGRSVESMSAEIHNESQQAEVSYSKSVKNDEYLDVTDDVKEGLANESFDLYYSDVQELERSFGSMVDDYTLVRAELELAIESVDNKQEEAVLRGYIKDIEDREAYWMNREALT